MKMIKYFGLTFLSAFITLGFSSAQGLTIQINPQLTTNFSAKSAWSFTVQNPSEKVVSLIFRAKISNDKGVPVALLQSETIPVNTGFSLYTELNLATEQIIYYDEKIRQIEELTGGFPVGIYSICISVICAEKDCNGAGADFLNGETSVCETITVDKITPLILTLPFDRDTIYETRPLMTWVPPGPVVSLPDLHYQLVLTELQPKQNSLDAIVRNIPLIQLTDVKVPMAQFPLDIDALVEGKSYCWQVEAVAGETFVGKSEVWQFTVYKDTTLSKPRDTFRYVQLKAKPDAIYVRVYPGQKIYFTYTSSNANEVLNYKVFNSKREVQPIKLSQETGTSAPVSANRLMTYGSRKYQLDAGLLELPKGYYTVEVYDSYKRTYYLQFEII